MSQSSTLATTSVTYWPSTEPSIKRCICVNKQKKAKQAHPVEDIGISPWPVDVVEFGPDAYAYRKQVSIKQLYSQVPQTAWVSLATAVGASWRQDASVRTASRQRTWALSDPRLSSPARMRKKCCYSQKNFGSICSSLSPSPTHHSHVTNINPFATLSRIKCERYIFYKEVCSFVRSLKFVIIIDYVSAYICRCICIVVCGYTTRHGNSPPSFGWLGFLEEN